MEPDQLLFRAVTRKDTELVNTLLAAGADVHYKEDIALRTACGCNDVALVRVLLRAGADVHIHNEFLLKNAVLNVWDMSMAETLIAAGADVRVDNDALIMQAVHFHQGDESEVMVQLLVDAGAGHLNDALSSCVASADIHVIKVLVDAGASVGTNLWRAAARRSVDVVVLLVEAGADVCALDNKAVKEASKYRCYDTVRYLVANGASALAALATSDAFPHTLRTYLLLSVPKADAVHLPDVDRQRWVHLRAKMRCRLRRFWYGTCVPRLWALPTAQLPAQPTEQELTAYLSTGGRLFARTYWKEDVHMFFPALGAQLGACPY